MVGTRSGRGYRAGKLIARSRTNAVGNAFKTWRKRTLGRQLVRIVGGGSATRGVTRPSALMRYGKYAAIPLAAYGLYKGGQYLYNKYKSSKKRTSTSRKRSAIRYATSGSYGGKVKYSKKSNGFDIYNQKGVVNVTEATGQLNDPNCVYLMNEVVSSRDLIFYATASVLRKLFEKAGSRITGFDDAVMTVNAGGTSTDDFTVRYIKQNHLTGAQTIMDYHLISTSTFFNVCDFFRNEFEQYCAGYGELSNQNLDEPLKLLLCRGKTTEEVNTNEDVRSVLLLNECEIYIKGTSEMKYQNRTKATGGSTDAEDINNNPLQGLIYEFAGVPKPKANGAVVGGTNGGLFAFERMLYNFSATGIQATSSGMDTTTREPVAGHLFWNCRKTGKVRLEPGQVKSQWGSVTKQKMFLKLLKSIRLQLTAAGQWSSYSIFPVQMVGLEDVINANAAENISIQWEIQRNLGCMCVEKPYRYTKSHYVTWS